MPDWQSMPRGKYRPGARAGVPASLGDAPGADAAVPVAGEQAEGRPGGLTARAGPGGRSLSEAVSWLTLA